MDFRRERRRQARREGRRNRTDETANCRAAHNQLDAPRMGKPSSERKCLHANRSRGGEATRKLCGIYPFWRDKNNLICGRRLLFPSFLFNLGHCTSLSKMIFSRMLYAPFLLLLLQRLQTQKSECAVCEGEREGRRKISCRVTLADDREVNKRRRKCLSGIAPRRHTKAPSWRRRSIRPSIRIL